MITLIIIVIVLIYVSNGTGSATKGREYLKEGKSKYSDLAQSILDMNRFLKSTPKMYLSEIERNEIKCKVEKILTRVAIESDLKKYLKKSKQFNDYLDLYINSQNIDELFKELNKRFVDKEIEKNSLLFDNIDGKSLDRQQREAVVTNETHNLVVAGAGSGKTLTISAKVRYLCEILKVMPKEILLISFTKSAAEEMSERIAKSMNLEVNAMTFHKLGLNLISSDRGYRPEIEDNMADYISDFVRNGINTDKKFAYDLLRFFAYYLYIPKDIEQYDSLGSYIGASSHANFKSLKSMCEPKKSLNGETMRSLEEVMIANFLFLNGVEYEYERSYPFPTEDRFRKHYKPDFYLKEYDIYLEHFGISEDGTCHWLSEMESKKYVDGMQWKRNLHKKNGTTLLETYSYYNTQGILLKRIEKILKTNGVKFKSVDKQKILEKLVARKQDREMKQFIELLCTFINLFKANGYTNEKFEEFKLSVEDNFYMEQRTKLFLNMAQDAYNYYQDIMGQKNAIDFSDMISMATDIVVNMKGHLHYKYVIIDEYQDIGVNRYKLVKAILDNCGARLMCVGDDWQSIYRFAGSDISLFNSFEKNWGASQTLKIEMTYRNSQQLIDIAGWFIMKNKLQINKELKSKTKCEEPVNVVYYKDNITICDAIKSSLDKIGSGDIETSVLMLGRSNYDKEILKDDSDFILHRDSNIVYKNKPNLKLEFLTIHKAKGLEADNVVILNMRNDILGFPNKISDDPVLRYVLTEEEPYAYAEERRLFYVALTRAKKRVYLITPERQYSEFIDEIRPIVKEINENSGDSILNNPGCPKCKTGKLAIRHNNNIDISFLGCSNYPFCDFSCNDTTILKNPIVCPGCGSYLVERKYGARAILGCINYPECNYKRFL